MACSVASLASASASASADSDCVEKCFKNCFRLNEHKATLQRTPPPPLTLLCTRYAHGLQALALFLTWRAAAAAAAASPASFQLVLIAERRENKAKLKLYTCCCLASRGKGGVAMPFCSMCKSQLSLVLNFYDETRRLFPRPSPCKHWHFVCRGKPNDSNSSAL